jgi:hypothetical protein
MKLLLVASSSVKIAVGEDEDILAVRLRRPAPAFSMRLATSKCGLILGYSSG